MYINAKMAEKFKVGCTVMAASEMPLPLPAILIYIRNSQGALEI
jgi:hypothetical protein